MDSSINDDLAGIEFAQNPEPRCPVVLLLDRSGSMQGEKIIQLNQGLEKFKADVLNDPISTARIEISIITFGPAKVVDLRNSTDQDIRDNIGEAFVTMDNFNMKELTAGGDTPMGEAVELGLDILRKRKEIYKSKGIDYYRPWMILITDGFPTDRWNFPRAFDLVKQEEDRKGIIFFGVGVEDADMTTLSSFSSRTPNKLLGLDFGALFLWVSKSLSAVAQSRPGEQVGLPPTTWVDTSV